MHWVFSVQTLFNVIVILYVRLDACAQLCTDGNIKCQKSYMTRFGKSQLMDKDIQKTVII